MIKVGIIGLGNIGLGYDRFSNLEQKTTLTHFSAVTNNSNYDLRFVADRDNKKIKKFKQKNLIKVNVFNDVSGINLMVDLLVLAVDPEEGIKLIGALAPKLQFKYVVGEKFGTLEKSKASELIYLKKKHNLKIFCNYYRRCLPETTHLKRLLKKETIKLITCNFTGGFKNTLCHFNDLIKFLTDEQVRVLSKNENGFQFKAGSISCSFNHLQNVDYDHYTLEIFTNVSRWFYDMDGQSLKRFDFKKDPLYTGSKIISDKAFEIERTSKNSMAFLYNEILMEVRGRNSINTSLEEDLINQECINYMRS